MSLTTVRKALLTPRPLAAQDSFGRADSASTLGNAETGHPWTALAGTWGITSNQANLVGTGLQSLAVVDAGLVDGEVRVAFIPGASGSDGGLVWRVADANNYLVVNLDQAGATHSLFKNVAGVFTQLATSNQTWNSGQRYLVRVLFGARMVLTWIDGVLKLQHELSAADYALHAANSKCGIRSNSDSASRFDDFLAARV